MKDINKMLWGVVLIILGLIIGLNSLKLTNINIFFDGWWTLFIIIPSVIGIITDKDKIGNIIGLVIGILLLLASNDIITFGLISKLLLPTILILIGVYLILHDRIDSKIKKEIKKINSKNKNKKNNEYCAIFGSNTLNSFDDVNGISLNGIFGELVVDLGNSKIDEDIVINASAIFGSVSIKVPSNVNVKTVGTPIFGSISNKVKTNNSKNTIFINCTAMFGGVVIHE